MSTTTTIALLATLIPAAGFVGWKAALVVRQRASNAEFERSFVKPAGLDLSKLRDAPTV